METHMFISSWANAGALMECRAHETNVRLWCVRWGVLSSLPVACTTFDNVSLRLKNNRLLGKDIRKVTWRIRKSVLTRSILAIGANLVVAIDVVLATVGVLTNGGVLPKMKKMAPAIHTSSPSQVWLELFVLWSLSKSFTSRDVEILFAFLMAGPSWHLSRILYLLHSRVHPCDDWDSWYCGSASHLCSIDFDFRCFTAIVASVAFQLSYCHCFGLCVPPWE